jgi:hypothetical protein
MPEPWMTRAACKGLTDLFFPERHDPAAITYCRTVCDRCPVWSACLDWAMTPAAPNDGIIAGYTPRERRQLRHDCPPSPMGEPIRLPRQSTGAMPRLTDNEAPWIAMTRVELLAARTADR